MIAHNGRRFLILQTSSGFKVAEVFDLLGAQNRFLGRKWRANSRRWTRKMLIPKALIADTVMVDKRLARKLAEAWETP